MKKYGITLAMVSVLAVYILYYSHQEKASVSVNTTIDTQSLTHPEKVCKRTIQITNNTNKKKTAYRYFGSNHYPSRFSIQVNDKDIPAGQTIDIDALNNKLFISYTYCFAKGLYKGKRLVTVTLDPAKEHFDLTFSWNNKNRVQVSNAHIIDHRKL